MDTQERKVISKVEENVEVSKESFINEKIEITKTVETEMVSEKLNLLKENFSIEHLDINKEINTIPKIREEGNVTIIPVVEEVAVVTKKLILIKEIRITRNSNKETKEINVALNKDKVNIIKQDFESPK